MPQDDVVAPLELTLDVCDLMCVSTCVNMCHTLGMFSYQLLCVMLLTTQLHMNARVHNYHDKHGSCTYTRLHMLYLLTNHLVCTCAITRKGAINMTSIADHSTI